MPKQIIVESCNFCPYCKDHYTDNLRIYEGTSCTHKENKHGRKIYLGGWEDRQNVHKNCPLEDADEVGNIVGILSSGGFETVSIGYDATMEAIREAAGPTAENLCSGYGVFPDGEKCKGCSDCNNFRNIDR